MTLAPELHLTIAEMLELPDNVMLKLSSRYFHELVKAPTFKQLPDGWQDYSSLCFLFRPCHDCCRLRPNAEFDYEEKIEDRGWSCIECKAQKQRKGYQIGDSIQISYGHVLCCQYEEFKGAIPRRVEGLCQPCWELFEGQGYRFSLYDDEDPAFLTGNTSQSSRQALDGSTMPSGV
ncbi:MAG: hypothetical protein ALECFALPRED_002161 [Alectoria fallacina]|uniref:F-box domain-containing protein n=1 Tax=Alectoria fallacina TaxID=1903189 RepID=A0A8H3EJ07_9LECA|nr:MAG: hypothetical protein ALECFALPRED_002161 [Alectoria fallacina]